VCELYTEDCKKDISHLDDVDILSGRGYLLSLDSHHLHERLLSMEEASIRVSPETRCGCVSLFNPNNNLRSAYYRLPSQCDFHRKHGVGQETRCGSGNTVWVSLASG